MSTKTGDTKPDDLDAVRLIAEKLAGFGPQDQERILRWAREKVGLKAEASPTLGTPAIPQPPISAGSAPRPDGGVKNIKSFLESKQPQSDNQFAAVVAYFYQFEAPEVERKPSITAEDLVEATRKAGRERIKKPGQTLINAHGRGYLDKADRGSYSLSTVGENLVAMALPTGQGTPTRAKRPKAKAKKKK